MSRWKTKRIGGLESLEQRQLLAVDLIVSEFVAKNSTRLDVDGEPSDWIEVFNQGDASGNLEDWYLTDDAGDLRKWRFPARTVRPGEAIVVFASAKNRNGSELHTNFRLAGSGEYLALVEPDGATIGFEFAPEFVRQTDDVSYGFPMQHVIAASQGNARQPIDATLVSHFTFDNASNLGNDTGTLNNNAVVVGNARFSRASKIGLGALFLDGDGDFLEIVNSGSDYAAIGRDGDGFTFAAWVNVSSGADGNRRLFSMDMEEATFQPRGWGVGLRDENTLLATTYGRVDFDEPSGGAIEDGDWRHLAYVFHPANGSVDFFIDGVFAGTETDTPVGIANSLANDDYLIGALNLTSSGNGQFFRGFIDDVRIYDTPLSKSEIASLTSEPESTGPSVRYLVPQDGGVDSTWMRNDFDDSTWSKSAAAIGYQANPVGIGGLIKQPVPKGTRSVYMRKSFQVDDPNDVGGLLLRAKYDDGFVAYLNGQVVATSNSPDSPRFDSVATIDRDISLASRWDSFDLRHFSHLLRTGTNTLAIHGLNDSASSDEFLIAPDLILVGATPLYLNSISPGDINSDGNDFGPLIEHVSHAPATPRAGQDILVTAQVTALSDPIESVTLHYRKMYETESTVRMNDAGKRGDAVADDGIYSAVIPARTASVGEMVRYYVTSQDLTGRKLREPFLPNPSDTSEYPEYLGTVIHDPRVTTDLPVFQWFVPNPSWHMRTPGNENGGNNRRWTSASAFFDGEFYDNIQVRTRGSATVQGWAKPKLKFEFNDVHEFRYADDQERVDEFNLQSHYIEVLPGAGLGSTAVAYMRETLAYEFLQDIGVPASTAFHMRVQQNGEFYSLASFIEQVDRTFLRRNGFDDDGPMYKATPTVRSTLAPNPNPGIYRKVVRKEEPFDDLRELTDGINGRINGVSVEQYIFDNINLPQVINEMAGQAILMNHDRLTKNYYMHKDARGTGEWSRFPWDVEQAFSDPQWDHFVSVLYGDSEHTQGTGNEPQYPNHLLDAILDTPRTRQMFLERVRTLIDEYLGADGPGYFEKRIDELSKLITPDATLDHARWQAGEIGRGIRDLKANIQKRREALARDPLVPRSDSVLRRVELLRVNAPVAVLVPNGPNDGIENGTKWQEGDASFPDTAENGWTHGTSGIGYDRRAGYQAFFNLDVEPLLDPDGDGTNSTNSVYSRFEFHVTNPAAFDVLELQMRYDDGFVAYLNGIEIARDRVPNDLGWEDRATRGREASDSFDLFPFSPTRADGVTSILRVGPNVLAIHGLNRSVTDSDMLIQPKIVGGILETRNFNIHFGSVDTDGVENENEIVYNPISGNQDEEYVSIMNSGNAAVDISGWKISGGIEAQFQPGTVLAPKSTLYVTPDVNAFRSRTTGPSGMQSQFVQASDSGHLSNFGETLSLVDDDGNLITTTTTPIAPSDVQSYLRVSEIHYNPAGNHDRTEFIELVNISEGANAKRLDLSGVTISDGPSQPFVFENGTSLAAGERLIVAADANAFRAAYPNVPASQVGGQYLGQLANGGEQIKIDDALGATVLQFEYGDNRGWPAAADGVGTSLELLDARHTPRDEYGKAARWASSIAVGGTPGRDIDLGIGVVINEVFADSDSPLEQTDAVELYNTTGRAIDIGGWYLSDSADQLSKFQIPVGEKIPAHGFATFSGEDFNPNPGSSTPNHFTIDGTDDELWLVTTDSQGRVESIVDNVQLNATAGASLGRMPDGGRTVVPQSRITMGSENRFARNGPLVIAEIQYHPSDPSINALAIDPQISSNRLEFIEVHNPTISPQSLDSWQISGGIDFAFNDGLMLPANGSVLVVPFNPDGPSNARRVQAFREHYGISNKVSLVGGYRGNLSNSDDVVRLLGPHHVEGQLSASVVFDEVRYDDRSPWPSDADGTGHSIHRSFAVSNGQLATRWHAASPTPGVANYLSLVRGDLQGDGIVDSRDIDRLFDAIQNRSQLDLFDVNRDGRVNGPDIDFLLNEILQSSPGDANLDGVFNSSDFVAVFQAGEYEDELEGNSTWAEGDWDGDGDFTTSDFVVAFRRYRVI